MAKLTTTTIAGAYASTTELNDNFALIEAAMEKCLFLDGTSPNIMSADIDLNGNDLLNVGNFTVTGAAREGVDILSTGETGGTKFLREDGDGTSSWQTVAGGGGGVWVQISDNTPTAATSLSYTWDETLYSEIKVIITGLQVATDDAQVSVQLLHTNGATANVINYTYVHFANTFGAHTTVRDGDRETQIYLTANTADGGASTLGVGNNQAGSFAEDLNAMLVFQGLESAEIGAMFTGQSSFKDTSGESVHKSFVMGVVGENNSGATPYGIYSYDGIKILASSGNFVAVGSVKIYGLTV